MKHIQTYQLTNKNGLSLEVLNLGGIIRSLHVPDANGVFSDVVLGFQEPKDYLNNSPYFGAIIGRYANRIDKGKFELNGKTYALETNNPPNHLHGGILGFDRVFWNVTPYKEDEGQGLCLPIFPKMARKDIPEIWR